jgi:hypothetical protein
MRLLVILDNSKCLQDFVEPKPLWKASSPYAQQRWLSSPYQPPIMSNVNLPIWTQLTIMASYRERERENPKLVSMWVKGQGILDDTLIQPSYKFYQHLPHTNNAFECILIGMLASIFLFKKQIVGFFFKKKIFSLHVCNANCTTSHLFSLTNVPCFEFTLNLPIYYIYP